MSLSENPLGLSTLDELISWTMTYLHVKQVLEVVTFQPAEADLYLKLFEAFRERLAKEMRKQDILEARLPKEMRETIAAKKPNLALIRPLLG